MSLNDTGTVVKEIQEMLKALNYTITADGIFGLKTYAAVRDF
ncbi:MAG: peptidoglycan-binding protein [Bacilli bacterium]